MMKKTLLFLLILVAGCSSVQQYEGAPRPASEIAKVYMSKEDSLVVGAINGKWRGIGNIQNFELLPGKHSLSVNYIQANAQSWGSVSMGKPIDLEFPAEAGKTYRLRRIIDLKNSRWLPWIEDEASGKNVSIIIRSIKSP